jgi:hypothetical protein
MDINGPSRGHGKNFGVEVGNSQRLVRYLQ